MKRNVIYVVLLCIIFSGNYLFAQVPGKLSYQALLTDDEGNPVANDNYTMTFRLYSAAAAAEPVWSEAQSVTIVNGVFNVILGSIEVLDIDFNRPYWLGISIGSNPELTPRTELTASPYALNAGNVDDGVITTSKISDDAVIADKIAAGQVVKSLNNIRDEITIAGGSGVTVTSSGDTVYISATTDSGDVNIFYSDWFGPNFNGGTAWESFDSFGGLRVNYIDKPAEEITQDVLEKGIILVFAKLNGYISSVWPQDHVSSLPITLMYISSGETNIDNWDFRISEGTIRIAFQNNLNTYQASGISTSHRFRYVVIPK
jgi:hypothetical protein